MVNFSSILLRTVKKNLKYKFLYKVKETNEIFSSGYYLNERDYNEKVKSRMISQLYHTFVYDSEQTENLNLYVEITIR